MTNVDVVVTGLGATTPLGGDVASTWDAMLAGRSGVRPLTQEWAQQLPVRIAASLAVDLCTAAYQVIGFSRTADQYRKAIVTRKKQDPGPS